MTSVDLFFLGMGTGLFLYTATSAYRLIDARNDVVETWDIREALAAQGADPDTLRAAGEDYNQAAAWYNDRLLHIPSNMLARLLGYEAAPLLKLDDDEG